MVVSGDSHPLLADATRITLSPLGQRRTYRIPACSEWVIKFARWSICPVDVLIDVSRTALGLWLASLAALLGMPFVLGRCDVRASACAVRMRCLVQATVQASTAVCL